MDKWPGAAAAWSAAPPVWHKWLRHKIVYFQGVTPKTTPKTRPLRRSTALPGWGSSRRTRLGCPRRVGGAFGGHAGRTRGRTRRLYRRRVGARNFITQAVDRQPERPPTSAKLYRKPAAAIAVQVQAPLGAKSADRLGRSHHTATARKRLTTPEALARFRSSLRRSHHHLSSARRAMRRLGRCARRHARRSAK